VTALSLDNVVHGSIEVVVIREEEFVRKVLNLPPVVGIADENSDVSAFTRTVADEFVNKLWIGVDV
jgi:hypothetical protein